MSKFKDKVKSFLKTRWAYFVSLIFIWLIPIIMLNEVVALTDTSTGFKVTFMGCLVLLFVFIAFRKKIFAIINKSPHGLLRGVLLCIHKLVTYSLILGVLWAISSFASKFYNWWLLVGISLGIGLVFVVVDEINARRRVDETSTN